jgi:hypothetical protein
MPLNRKYFLPWAVLGFCFAAVLLYPRATATGSVDPGLTAHEWGTFTSVAGQDGQALEWSPLIGSTDLPGFVEHFRNAGFKLGLRGTVRMETPVLYFYSSREETVSVNVSLANGIITEWYPRASRVAPTSGFRDASLKQERVEGSIAWDSVTIIPSLREEFPKEGHDSHYYAARMTSSAPLRVKTDTGDQHEKFLFYRGVANFSVPVSARLAAAELLVENRGSEEIPATILFERRGERVGYRIGGAVRQQATLAPPELNGNIDDLGRDLEGLLVAQGLYQNEAHAMVETWRTSWFEEGSRLFYIGPAKFVNDVVPLAIHPAPAQVVRVFVGRLELVTPATQRAVERAFATHDNSTLRKYDRFLEPILQTMIHGETSPAKSKELNQYLATVYSAEIAAARQRAN